MRPNVLARSLGARIKAERLACGLTQHDLAKESGVSERRIRTLEHGESTNVTLRTMCQLWNALGMADEMEKALGIPPSKKGKYRAELAFEEMLRQRQQSQSKEQR